MLYTATWPDRPEAAMPAQRIEELDVFGPNMAVRAGIVAQGLRFDEQLMAGPSGLLGDETEFLERILERGHKPGFAATARVRHIVNPSQLTVRWMLRRFYRHGRTIVYFETGRGTYECPRCSGFPGSSHAGSWSGRWRHRWSRRALIGSDWCLTSG